MMIDFLKDYVRFICEKEQTTICSPGDDLRTLLGEHKQRLSPIIYSVLLSCWPEAPTTAGPYTLTAISELASDADMLSLPSKGYLPIGSTDNGDILVVQLDTIEPYDTSVGLLNHETFYDDDCPLDFAPVATSYPEFFYRLTEFEYLPIDFYSARDLDQLRQRYSRKPPNGLDS